MIELADLAANLISKPALRSETSLEPEEMLYALETELNRQYKAGKPTKDDLISNLNYFPYETDEDGKISSEFLLEMYNDITTNIGLIRQGGLEFYMVDIELLANQNVFVVDIIATMSFYLGEGFGFLYFDEDVNYHVFWDSFENEVNDRLIFEYLNEDEYFYTDITPNPSSEPFGWNVSSSEYYTTAQGGCTIYYGTLEEYGGPETVLGGNPYNTTLNGELMNQYIDKGLDFFSLQIPENTGFQLMKLKFGISENPYVIPGEPCLPGSSCNYLYPCFRYTHYWAYGFMGRKTAISK